MRKSSRIYVGANIRVRLRGTSSDTTLAGVVTTVGEHAFELSVPDDCLNPFCGGGEECCVFPVLVLWSAVRSATPSLPSRRAS